MLYYNFLKHYLLKDHRLFNILKIWNSIVTSIVNQFDKSFPSPTGTGIKVWISDICHFPLFYATVYVGGVKILTDFNHRISGLSHSNPFDYKCEKDQRHWLQLFLMIFHTVNKLTFVTLFHNL